MELDGREFVFGYGSLAALGDGVAPSRTPRAEGFVCDLRGYRRQWGVAMDNSRDLPGYKHYTDAVGRRHIGPPIIFAAEPAQPVLHAPALGEHNTILAKEHP